MARYYHLLLLVTVILLSKTARSVVIEASTEEITSGLTSLTVNCSFSYTDTNITGINTLTISKAFNQSSPPQDLATINAFSPNQVTLSPSDTNASATGSIDINGASHLIVQLTNPTELDAGIYRCQADGMDNSGQPTSDSQTVRITSHTVQITSPTQSSGDTGSQLAALQNLTDTMLSRIEALEALTSPVDNTHLMESLSKLEKLEFFIEKTLQTTRDALFLASEEFEDRIYLLSKHTFRDADVAEATCEVYGGYLVEIENATEHEFIKGFISTIDVIGGMQLYGVLTGATDEVEEGLWVYRYSNNTMNYTDWHSDEPNSPMHDCMILYSYNLWQMADDDCHHKDSSYHYLCEVPNEA